MRRIFAISHGVRARRRGGSLVILGALRRLTPLTLLQLPATAALLTRLARGRRRRPPLRALASPLPDEVRVSVVVPARDEALRIGPCLLALADDPDVHEIVVVDDRSADATAAVAREHGARVVAGAELPAGWVGKPWALQQGLEAARGDVVVTLDADTRPRPGLVGALVADLLTRPAETLTTATVRFRCDGAGERVLHPAFTCTLVYRFGPGDVDDVQPHPDRAVANGQCLAARRAELLAAGGFALAAPNMTDDVALARALRRRHWELRTVDAADLLDVRMYESAAQTWSGWGRSLMATDATTPTWTALDLAVLWLTQALPLPRLLLGRGTPLDVVLLAVRLALHAALRRTYAPRGLPFWLAPLADLPAVGRLSWAVARPARTWRGRTYAPAAPAGRTAPR